MALAVAGFASRWVVGRPAAHPFALPWSRHVAFSH